MNGKKQIRKINKILFISFLLILLPIPLLAADYGESCTTHADCTGSRCQAVNGCYCSGSWGNKCADKWTGGASCVANENCLSGTCGTDGKCTGDAAAAGDLNGTCTNHIDCSGPRCQAGSGCFCNRNKCNLTNPAGLGCNIPEMCFSGRCESGRCAAGTPISSTGPVEWTSPLGSRVSPGQIIGKIIKTVLGIIGAIALLMFVYGGLMWMTAAGSPERIKKAQTTLVWAVLGLAVIFASYTLVDFILEQFGV